MNKKLIKTISVACGCTAICGVGIGGLVYSTFNGSSASAPTPVPDPDKFVEKCLPVDVLNIDNNVLKGYKSDISDETWASYEKDGYNTLFIPKNVNAINKYAFAYSIKGKFITSIHFEQSTDSLSIGWYCFMQDDNFTRIVFERPISLFDACCFVRLKLNIIKFYGSTNWLDSASFNILIKEGPFGDLLENGTIICRNGGDADHAKKILEENANQPAFATWLAVNVD